MFFTRDGARIAYEDSGAPPGRPGAATVVLGHALMFGGWAFRDQVAALRGEYRCVTIDWRGQGGSHRVRHGFDMDTLAADLVLLIELLKTGPVHYVGQTMGGVVGLRLAISRPDLLRSLTLLNTSAGPEEAGAVRSYERLANGLLLLGRRRLQPRLIPLLFGSAFLASPRRDEVMREWLDHLLAGRRRGLRKAALGVIRRSSVEADVARITAPTLIVVGADDVMTPLATARQLGATLPGSKVRVVPGAAHSITLEQPGAVTTLIRDHIAGR